MPPDAGLAHAKTPTRDALREQQQRDEQHREDHHQGVVGANIRRDQRLQHAEEEPGGQHAHHRAEPGQHHHEEGEQRVAQADLRGHRVDGAEHRTRHRGEAGVDGVHQATDPLHVDAHQPGVLLALRGGADSETGAGVEQERQEQAGGDDREGEAGHPDRGCGDAEERDVAGEEFRAHRAGRVAEHGEQAATDQRGEAEGERQPHQRGQCVLARADPVDQRRDEPADGPEGDEYDGEQQEGVDPQLVAGDDSSERAEDHPHADREVDDVENAERQREADADGDVEATDENPPDERLRQFGHGVLSAEQSGLPERIWTVGLLTMDR